MLHQLGMLTARNLEGKFIHLLRKRSDKKHMKKIQPQMEKHSLLQSSFLVTRMLDICDQNGEIDYARLLFYKVLEPNIFLYNAMIRGYTHQQMYVLTL